MRFLGSPLCAVMFVAVAVKAAPFGYGCTTPGQRALAPVFCDHTLPHPERVASLVSQMSLAEKVNLTWISGCTDADPTDGGVPRLGIPGYTWGVEILHGAQSMCVNSSCPTIFPVLASLGSSFNRSAWHAMGAAISTEMRALNNLHVGRKDCPQSMIGINGWGPNVNIVRDPRWGRNIEVPTEDPMVAAALAEHVVKGLQGDVAPGSYTKLLASIKHFSVYSMEASDGQSRTGFDPTVSLRDMAESYLPAFQGAIDGGNVLGMMCSYTSVNGTAFCESQTWIQQWAREKHGFQGNVVTDCGALNMPGPESKMDTPHNAAAALSAGVDLNCGQPWAYNQLGEALNQSLVQPAQLDAVVSRSLALRMSAGMFDPVAPQEYTRLGLESLGSEAHRALAYEIAAQGLVLLQNPSGALPFNRTLHTAVIGPHAVSNRSLLGSYFDQACPGLDDWSCVQTPLQAIAGLLGSGSPPLYSPGCHDVACESSEGIAAAVAAAEEATQVVLLVGIDEHQEGEGHDRTSTRLPGAQEQLVRSVLAVGKPTVVVLLNGGIVSVDDLKNSSNPQVAAVEAWYPGIAGAAAIADALFGRINKWGKLPVTVYASSFSSQVKMTDMSFVTGLGRTYKYWRGDAPLFEFGSGFSYTDFDIGWVKPQPAVTFTRITDAVNLTVSLSNTGAVAGDEVLFVFHQPSLLDAPPSPLPAKQLVDFSRSALEPGQAREVTFTVSGASLGLVDAMGDRLLFGGSHVLTISRGHGQVLTAEVRVDVGAPLVIERLF